MKYPDRTTIWVRKVTRDRYSKYGLHSENYDEILTRRADEHELLQREVLRIRAKLKKFLKKGN